jgi:hypothetical protein
MSPIVREKPIPGHHSRFGGWIKRACGSAAVEWGGPEMQLDAIYTVVDSWNWRWRHALRLGVGFRTSQCFRFLSNSKTSDLPICGSANGLTAMSTRRHGSGRLISGPGGVQALVPNALPPSIDFSPALLRALSDADRLIGQPAWRVRVHPGWMRSRLAPLAVMLDEDTGISGSAISCLGPPVSAYNTLNDMGLDRSSSRGCACSTASWTTDLSCQKG